MTWDAEELAQAFRVTVPDVREYLTDGRRVSFIIERRLKWENPGWSLAPSEGAGYDLLDPEGGLWEVRCITRGACTLTPLIRSDRDVNLQSKVFSEAPGSVGLHSCRHR